MFCFGFHNFINDSQTRSRLLLAAFWADPAFRNFLFFLSVLLSTVYCKWNYICVLHMAYMLSERDMNTTRFMSRWITWIAFDKCVYFCCHWESERDSNQYFNLLQQAAELKRSIIEICWYTSFARPFKPFWKWLTSRISFIIISYTIFLSRIYFIITWYNFYCFILLDTI